jgi:hypothetical protein
VAVCLRVPDPRFMPPCTLADVNGYELPRSLLKRNAGIAGQAEGRLHRGLIAAGPSSGRRGRLPGMVAGPGEHAERETSSWLTSGLHESVASLGVETLVYDDQAAPARLTKEHFEHLVRKLKILRWLDRLPCESFLDVGAGADHVPVLVRERRGADTYYGDLVDEAAVRAEAVQRLCGSDATRAAAVRRLAARLRRNERPPGTLKRAAWRVEHVLGSPPCRRGLWPVEWCR